MIVGSVCVVYGGYQGRRKAEKRLDDLYRQGFEDKTILMLSNYNRDVLFCFLIRLKI